MNQQREAHDDRDQEITLLRKRLQEADDKLPGAQQERLAAGEALQAERQVQKGVRVSCEVGCCHHVPDNLGFA